MMKLTTFLHLCTTLCDYQKLVNSHEAKPTSSCHEKFEVENLNNYQLFRKKKKRFSSNKPSSTTNSTYK
jgi:hypothetical protein